jgi:hypothetical protein
LRDAFDPVLFTLLLTLDVMEMTRSTKLCANSSGFSLIRLICGPLMLLVLQVGHADWTLPALDVSTTGGNASDIQVATNENGVPVAVWTKGGVVQTSLYDSAANSGSGGWGSPTDLTSSGTAYFPKLVVDSAGVVTVVWAFDNGASNGNWKIQTIRSNSGGTWTGPVPSVVDLTDGSKDARKPDIALMGSGSASEVIVVWSAVPATSTFSATRIIQSKAYSSGQWGSVVDLSVGSELLINSPIYAWSVDDGPRVAANAGAAQVVWIHGEFTGMLMAGNPPFVAGSKGSQIKTGRFQGPSATRVNELRCLTSEPFEASRCRPGGFKDQVQHGLMNYAV